MFAQIVIAALAIVPVANDVARESVDLVELNHFYELLEREVLPKEKRRELRPYQRRK